ncbi:hydrolase [Oscillospiraceae bacterium HV4-5-C5C]|nr:hydrolase [Oscillospiraceae bacterium HV4-5-C5C]
MHSPLPDDSSSRQQPSLSREQAWQLLTCYNQDPFHLEHARTVEAIMTYLAQSLGYAQEAAFWGLVGLLHDLDFEQFPQEHCHKSQALMLEAGIDPQIIRATASHGYGICCDIQPEHQMEKVLYATDELSGLIGACALVRPSRSTLDMEAKSVKKKFKQNSFAAGCSRPVIQQGADMLGWSLDELIARTLEAMQAYERSNSKRPAR